MALPRDVEARLLVLQDTGDCCDDLPGLVAAAQAAEDDPRRAQYAALGERRRFLIAAMLQRRPRLCGCEIQAALDLSHATVSHHMRILLDAGLVEGAKEGKWMRYTLSPAGAALVP